MAYPPRTGSSHAFGQSAAQSAAPTAAANQLASFLGELQGLGCLSGFRYFEPYLRGREELLVRVSNDGRPHHTYAHANVLTVVDPLGNVDLSARTRRILRDSVGLRNLSDHPPASPCDRELERDNSRTTFLVAGYARYGKPFVWLRSADQKVTERLARLHSQTDPASPTGQPSDVPLKLDTTSRWVTEAVYLTDIIEELVDLTVRAENPFSVDHDYLDTLSLEESVLLSGALVEFLSALWMRGGKFADKVWPDIQTLVSRHTKELCQLHKAKT